MDDLVTFYKSMYINPPWQSNKSITLPRLILNIVLPPRVTAPIQRWDQWNVHNLASTSRGKLRFKGQNSKRDYVFNKLKELGCSDDIAVGLTVLAGAESGYNPQAWNSSVRGGGLGGWLTSFGIIQSVLDHINLVNGTHHTSLQQTSLDELIEALKWFYYDKNKSRADAAEDKALFFSKLGFSPAIAKTGKATWKGKNYNDTPEDWTRYMNDTGNNPNGRWATFNDMFAQRVSNAGFEYN